ncbi:MAG: NADH:flavin oxidoreductase/NADH oxidase [Rhodospirillales bacterium]|nr:NADH:flavin oxidoreductase/NADH oxidase [Rhodospirillales bacterium]
MTNLFDPVQLGELDLSNRIVMAPMTRSRAGEDDAPTELNVEYYRQRASAGLIVTEGTQPSANGKGYCRTPGIHSAAQIAGWRKVTDAVHAEGGKIALQVMHCGRIGAKANKDAGAETIAPSAIRAAGQMFTDTAGMVDFDMPRALETDEIPALIAEFGQATRNALEAGFDGVELHAASGYLPMQFLSTSANKRTDRYGGSVENRIRAVVEMLEAMSEAAGPGRIGIRICPGVVFNGIQDDDPAETYSTLLRAIDPMGLAYLHLILLKSPQVDGLEVAKASFTGAMILNDSITLGRGNELVDSEEAAAISFARHFLSNPDLVRRFREGADLQRFDRKTLYTPGPVGYTDYPFMIG